MDKEMPSMGEINNLGNEVGTMATWKAVGMGSEGYVPVYMPDRVIVGKAHITDDGRYLQIELTSNSLIRKLFEESLVGLSVMYMDKDRAEDVITKEENN